ERAYRVLRCECGSGGAASGTKSLYRVAGASLLLPEERFVPRDCDRPVVAAPPAPPWPEERLFAPVVPLARVVLEPLIVVRLRLRTLVRVDTPVLTATPARRCLTTTLEGSR